MEPKYTAQNILAGWDELQERNKKRRRLPTIVNELYSLSDPNFRSSGAYLRNKKYIDGLGGAEFTDYSRRMKLLAEAEQSELDSLFMGRMADTDIPNVEAFDDWVTEQGSYVQGKRDKFFTSWDKRMDTIREQSQYAEEANIDTVVGAMMAQYYDRMATTTDPVAQNSIILEANKAVTELASNYPNESGKIRSIVNDRLRKIVGDTTGVRNATQKAAEREETIEDRNRVARDRALDSGRTILRNRLVQEVVDRVSAGQDFDTVKLEVMSRANDRNSRDYIQDRDILASLRAGIDFAKKPDVRSTASKNFDETMALLRPTNPYSNVVEDERAFNTSKVIQLEMDSGKLVDPRWYEYTMPQKMSQAVEQTFLKLKLADPYFDETAIIDSFAVFDAADPTEEQSERKLEDLGREYKLPVDMILYILLGKKKFEEHLGTNVYVQ